MATMKRRTEDPDLIPYLSGASVMVVDSSRPEFEIYDEQSVKPEIGKNKDLKMAREVRRCTGTFADRKQRAQSQRKEPRV